MSVGLIEAKRHIGKYRYDAIVSDGDNTLWKGSVAAGIGKRYLVRELIRVHLPTFLRARKGAERVREIARSDPINGPIDGMKEFYAVLMANKLGNKDEMSRYATRYIRKNANGEVAELLRPTNILTFLSTLGGSTGASAARCIYNMIDFASNLDIFGQKDRLEGIEITLRTGEDKLRATHDMLNRYEVDLNMCVAIGDSEADIPLLSAAKLKIASPFAIEDVKRIADFQLEKDKEI